MNKMLKAMLGTVAGVALLASSAQATLFNYDVTGWGPQSYPFNPGYPGDTLELIALTGGSIDLADGIAQVGKINTLKWTLDYSGGNGQPSDADLTVTTSRDINAAGITQGGLLQVRFYNDTLTINQGGPVIFDLGGYTVTVTPLALGPIVRGDLGTLEYDVNASFLLAQKGGPSVPDAGATMSLLGIAVIGLGAIRRKIS